MYSYIDIYHQFIFRQNYNFRIPKVTQKILKKIEYKYFYQFLKSNKFNLA